jgi:DNA-binding transcriptional MerR regulator
MEELDTSVESPYGRRVNPMVAVGMKTGMKIGALAGRSGLPVKTLRYYEDLGLLPAIGRSEGGYRLFAEESLRRLEFIRRLKTLGLSLEEIQGCLAVHDAGDLPCGDIEIQLGRQIERIDGQIKELRQLRTELKELLAGWQSDPAKDDEVICPNLHV